MLVAVVAAVVVIALEAAVVVAVAGGWKPWEHYRTKDETEQ